MKRDSFQYRVMLKSARAYSGTAEVDLLVDIQEESVEDTGIELEAADVDAAEPAKVQAAEVEVAQLENCKKKKKIKMKRTEKVSSKQTNPISQMKNLMMIAMRKTKQHLTVSWSTTHSPSTTTTDNSGSEDFIGTWAYRMLATRKKLTESSS